MGSKSKNHPFDRHFLPTKTSFAGQSLPGDGVKRLYARMQCTHIIRNPREKENLAKFLLLKTWKNLFWTNETDPCAANQH